MSIINDMQEPNVTTKIDFKNLIEITNSKQYIDFARTLADNLTKGSGQDPPQQISLPVSSDQPEDMPFVIHQGSKLQILFTRRSLQISSILDPNSNTQSMAAEANKVLSCVFNNSQSIIRKENIRSITTSISKSTEINSFSDIKTFLQNTKYKSFANDINELGFSLSYFSNSNIEGISGESITYTSIVNHQTHTKGVQTALRIIVGGIDLETADFKDLNSSDVENYTNNLTVDNIDNLLRKTYGLADSEQSE